MSHEKIAAQEALDDVRNLVNRLQEPLGLVHMHIHSPRHEVTVEDTKALRDANDALGRVVDILEKQFTYE